MGRPVNKKYFGTPTAAGKEIKVDFWGTASVVQGYIVKQLGSKKFRVAALGTGGTPTYDRFLTWGKLPAALTGTEMSISVKADDGETYNCKKIAGRKMTVVAPTATGANAYDGKSIPWNFSTALDDGAVEVEEAGDDDAGTNATDFVEDV
jgi:hypothetical protein